MLTNGNEVSLYFHIPFCTKKCDYCHFYVIPDKDPLHLLLMEGLFLDLDRWKSVLTDKKLVSIYFGGGTPSLLHPDAIDQILEKVRRYIPFSSSEIEITLEANPEKIDEEKLRAFRSAGINRLSIGIQSLDDSLLTKLGRTHYADAAIQAIEAAVNSGISNISIDLMYDIPGQSLDSWQQTLFRAASLPITHLSLYNLTIEPNTVFFKYRDKLQKELPDAETSAQMYQMAIETLEGCGLKQYEISAFARNGQLSRHNVGYWTGRPFLGFGPSAFSYWEGKRFRAMPHLQRYVGALKDGQSPIDFSEELAPDKQCRELLAIGLRLLKGVELDGPIEDDLWAAIQRLQNDGFLEQQNQTLCLTQKGRLFYDTVAIEIV